MQTRLIKNLKKTTTCLKYLVLAHQNNGYYTYDKKNYNEESFKLTLFYTYKELGTIVIKKGIKAEISGSTKLRLNNTFWDDSLTIDFIDGVYTDFFYTLNDNRSAFKHYMVDVMDKLSKKEMKSSELIALLNTYLKYFAIHMYRNDINMSQYCSKSVIKIDSDNSYNVQSTATNYSDLFDVVPYGKLMSDNKEYATLIDKNMETLYIMKKIFYVISVNKKIIEMFPNNVYISRVIKYSKYIYDNFDILFNDINIDKIYNGKTTTKSFIKFKTYINEVLINNCSKSDKNDTVDFFWTELKKIYSVIKNEI